jgi:alkylhydroperoxidase family enzyme
MPRIPVHTIDDAAPPSADLLRSIVHASPTGKPLNMQAQMAESPAVLAQYVSLRRAVDEHGTLEPHHRSAVMTTAAATLGAPYVEAITGMLSERSGWSTEEVRRFQSAEPSGDERLDALLAVTRQVAENLGEVSDELWDFALAQGWSTEQLTESFAFVAIALYSAYFVNLARTEFDLPVPAPTAAR